MSNFTFRVSAEDLGDSLCPRDYADGPALLKLKAELREAIDSLTLDEAMTLQDFITNHLPNS